MPPEARLLAGVRVLDLSIWRPGPYATSLLVALGADTLKVEPPGGDPMRHYTGLFESINSGKRSIELNLKEESGRVRAMELAVEADVVVEGFRPGVMARLGLDDSSVRAHNPGVVYCSISGYGQHDPRADLPGHDVNYQAWAGALAPEGGPATSIPPLPVADLAGGLTAAFGICAALIGRARSGHGSYLDVSMTDVLSTWTGRSGAGGGSDRTTVVPGYGLFTTADGGQVSLGVLNEQHFWSALCEELGMETVAGLGFEERTQQGAELQRAVRNAIASKDRDGLVSDLAAAGVPVAPVLNRTEMLSSMPFPAFPIRIPVPDPPPPVPALDEHRGQGFLPRS